MVGTIPDDKRADLVQGLTGLSETEEGRDILESVLGTAAIVEVAGAEAHLGEYGANLQHVPGMGTYIEDRMQS